MAGKPNGDSAHCHGFSLAHSDDRGGPENMKRVPFSITSVRESSARFNGRAI
jgi:hypothetical protein